MDTLLRYSAPGIRTLSGADIIECFGPTAGGSLIAPDGFAAAPPVNPPPTYSRRP